MESVQKSVDKRAKVHICTGTYIISPVMFALRISSNRIANHLVKCCFPCLVNAVCGCSVPVCSSFELFVVTFAVFCSVVTLVVRCSLYFFSFAFSFGSIWSRFSLSFRNWFISMNLSVLATDIESSSIVLVLFPSAGWIVVMLSVTLYVSLEIDSVSFLACLVCVGLWLLIVVLIAFSLGFLDFGWI